MSEIPPPKPADVRLYRWKIAHLSRWLEHKDNVDHPFVMGAHIERSGYAEALRSLGYPIEE